MSRRTGGCALGQVRPSLKPLGSVLFSDESGGSRDALGFHRLAVPVEILLQLEGDDPGQADLSQLAADLERREGLSVVEDRIDPFLKMPPHARKTLWHFFRLGMVGVSGEFFVAFQLDVAL